MKKLMVAFLMLVTWFARADIPHPKTVDFDATYAPDLECFQANEKTWQWTVRMAGSKANLTGYTGVMYIARSTGQGQPVVIAGCSVQNASNGIFNAKFSPTDLNTNGSFIYGVGISSGKVTIARQGKIAIYPDPYASGTPITWTNAPVNLSLYTFLGNLLMGGTITAGAFIGDGSGLTGIGGAATNGLAGITYVQSVSNDLSAELRGIIPSTNGFVTASITNPLSDRVSNLTAADVGAVSPDDTTYTDTVARASTALQEDTYFEDDPQYHDPIFGARLKSKYTSLYSYGISTISLTAFNIISTNSIEIQNQSELVFGNTEQNKFRFRPNGAAFPIIEIDNNGIWNSYGIPSNAIDPYLDLEYRLVYDFTPTSNEMTRLAGINATNITAATNLAYALAGVNSNGIAANTAAIEENSNAVVILRARTNSCPTEIVAPEIRAYPRGTLYGTNAIVTLSRSTSIGHAWFQVGYQTNALSPFVAIDGYHLASTTNADATFTNVSIPPQTRISINVTNLATVTSNFNSDIGFKEP